MGPTPIVTIAGVAALAAALLASFGASAQWNNQPYQFRNTPGSGAGMSIAYRQAILNEELFGRRPDNLVRGADGRLLEVFKRDQQAFLAEPEPNFLVGGGARGGIFVGGIGIGAAPIGQWTGLLAVGPVVDYAATRRPDTPIDAWVGMLD